MFCPSCGKSHDADALFCAGCGDALSSGLAGDASLFYKAAIGPKRQQYYLSRFAAFDANGKTGVTWHWPAFFLPFYWFLYRKMWLSALIYFLLPYVLLIGFAVVLAMLGAAPDPSVNLVTGLYFIASYLLPGLYANALYYKHCNKKIAQARAASADVQHQLGAISAKGGTSGIAMVLILILVFVALVGILAAIAIPAYQDYTTRAKLVRAVSVADQGAADVGRYFAQHQQMPDSLAAAGFTAPALPAVRSFEFDSQSGALTVLLAAPPLDGQRIMLVPTISADKQLAWTCGSPDVRPNLLPPRCRGGR